MQKFLAAASRRLQLAAALMLALLWELASALKRILLGPAPRFQKLQDLLSQSPHLLAALRAPQEVPDELVQARMEICRQCPVFFSPLQSCGSPLREILRRLRRLKAGSPENSSASPKILRGCFCHLPTKARLHENCWAYDERLPDLGWPAAINSFPRPETLPPPSQIQSLLPPAPFRNPFRLAAPGPLASAHRLL
jgi:hypothetical protein